MVAVATVNLASVALLAQCSLMAEEAVTSGGHTPAGLAVLTCRDATPSLSAVEDLASHPIARV